MRIGGKGGGKEKRRRRRGEIISPSRYWSCCNLKKSFFLFVHKSGFPCTERFLVYQFALSWFFAAYRIAFFIPFIIRPMI